MADEKKSRIFEYSSTKLEDPDANKSVEWVKNYYANHYTELTTATVEGPTTTPDGKEKYVFKKAVHTKG